MGADPLLLGVDLGGTNCRMALVEPDGKTLHTERTSTDASSGRDAFLQRLEGLCHEMIRRAGDMGRPVAAVGIGTPGVISAGGLVEISPNLPHLNGLAFAGHMQTALRLPVLVMNDANAIAVGEARLGAGRQFSSSLTVTLGTGVGGGLVLNGRLWEGADGAAGEIGHIMVEPEGRPCGCGSRGCLEQYSSARGLVRNVLEAIDLGVPSRLSSIEPSRLTSEQVAAAARQGDTAALAALAEGGRRLGQALAAVANLLNIDGVIITGGASDSLDLMRPSLDAELKIRGFAIPVRRLKIVQGKLKDRAGMIGAARLAWDRLLHSGQPDFP
ncbi:MAG: ROK family protein [Desulfuromonadales bacterium]|nr:ROK family protein [Desulfuromonadales bacterium]MDW7758457.1 ROK family protein [Desulfuromonadales bacterium]